MRVFQIYFNPIRVVLRSKPNWIRPLVFLCYIMNANDEEDTG